TYVINLTAVIPVLGTSGDTYGLFGMYIFMSFRRRDLIDPQNAQIVRTIFIIGIIMTFIRPNINIAAHIFGFLGGVIVAPLFLRNAQPFYKPTYRKMKSDDDDIGFDPNRWKKRRFLSLKARRNLLWV